MRSDAERLTSLRRTFPEGEREGSIHFNAPSEHCFEDVFPNETVTDMDSSSEDEPQPARLSKEQLRNLLNDFLDQLIVSKPPARDSGEGKS